MTPTQCETIRKLDSKLREVKTPFPLGQSKSAILTYLLGELGRPGTPGGLPPGPGEVDLGPLGNNWALRGENTRLDMLVASPSEQPVEARLYDDAGVLVGRAAPDARGGTRLGVDGLQPGANYVLQTILMYDGSRETAVRVPLLIKQAR